MFINNMRRSSRRNNRSTSRTQDSAQSTASATATSPISITFSLDATTSGDTTRTTLTPSSSAANTNRNRTRMNNRSNNNDNNNGNNNTALPGETTSLLINYTGPRGGNPNRDPEGDEEETNNDAATAGDENNNDNNDNTNDNNSVMEDLDEEIRIVTNRLRLLFITLTYPILPLAFILIILVIELITTAFDSPSCGPNHPLKGYAFFALGMSLYTPYHRSFRRWLFNYESGNGNTRPRSVLIYDQCFHILCVYFVYSGMSILSSCQRDLVQTDVVIVGGDTNSIASDAYVGGNGVDSTAMTTTTTTTESICSITCTDLYDSMSRFVLVLKIFFVVLVLPLVCLPCVFLWIRRRIRTEEAWARFGRAVDGVDAETNVDIKDVMNGLTDVGLVPIRTKTGRGLRRKMDENFKQVKVMRRKPNKNEDDVETGVSGDDEDDSCLIVGEDGTKKKWEVKEWEAVKDCSICLREFPTTEMPGNGNNNGYNSINIVEDDPNVDKDIVMTKCGHLFHKKCIGSWIAGDWDDELNEPSSTTGRAQRRTCPICRKDLAVED